MVKRLIKTTKGLLLILAVLLMNTLPILAQSSNFKPIPIDLNQAQDISEVSSSPVSSVPGSSAVLGCSAESPVGCDFINEISYQPLCTQVNGSVVVGDGSEVGQSGNSVKVQKNSLIEVTKVTVPLALLSGSEYIEDSRMAISNEFPTFRSSSNMITEAETRRFCSPGADCAEVDRITNEGVDEGPFSVHVQADLPQSKGDSGEADATNAVIKKELESACPDLQKSEPNPNRTNLYGERLDRSFQAPGEHKTTRNNGSAQCVESNPNGVELPKSEAFVSCITEVKPANFLVQALIKLEQWAECTIGDDADPSRCTDSELFAIKVDAIFGSVYECNEGSCSSKYFDLTRQANAAPGVSKSLSPADVESGPNDPVVQPFYVTTMCEVMVDKKRKYDIPCLWDVSPYQRVYEQQKASAAPGDPDFPETWEEYWEKVEYDVERRGLSCS